MYEDDSPMVSRHSSSCDIIPIMPESIGGSDTDLQRSIQELPAKKKRLSYESNDSDAIVDISSAFHFLSPVKDLSKMQLCFSPPEQTCLELPLGIGCK